MENNWKVGDVALCINNGELPNRAHEKGHLPELRLNTEYVVNNIRTCECGRITLDVGLSLGENPTRGVSCQCGAITSPKTGIHWCAAERFIKKRTEKDVEAQIAEAVANEDYMLAEELRKLNLL